MPRRSWAATRASTCGRRSTAGGSTSAGTICRPRRHRKRQMTGILSGLRVVEGSAVIPAPLGGMTLAQLGPDVIRFDDLAGGLDSDRWPVTKDGASIYWAGLNKGKRP